MHQSAVSRCGCVADASDAQSRTWTHLATDAWTRFLVRQHLSAKWVTGVSCGLKHFHLTWPESCLQINPVTCYGMIEVSHTSLSCC